MSSLLHFCALVSLERWWCFHYNVNCGKVQEEYEGTTKGLAGISGVVEDENPTARLLRLLLCKKGAVKKATNVHVSAQMVRNRLHEEGVRVRRPQMGLVLTRRYVDATLSVLLCFSEITPA